MKKDWISIIIVACTILFLTAYVYLFLTAYAYLRWQYSSDYALVEEVFIMDSTRWCYIGHYSSDYHGIPRYIRNCDFEDGERLHISDIGCPIDPREYYEDCIEWCESKYGCEIGD